MHNNLRILHLEDDQSDALLVSYALKQGGLKFDHMVVDTKERFLEALNDFDPDVILADHSLPSFNSYEALELLGIQESRIPVILVTAAMSDEFAVNALKKGARDYVLKDRLKRLPSAIRNVLKAQRLEKERDGFLIQLQQNERKFRSLIENGADAVIILTLDGTPSYVTPSLMRVLGYSEKDALELNIFDIIHERHHECVREKLKECQASPKTPFVGYTLQVRHQNGSWRWLEATLTSYMEDLAIKGIVADFRDVTDRILAEKTIKESEEKYRSFFENSLDGILLTSPEGSIFAANTAACQMFQRTELDICKVGRAGVMDMTDPRVEFTVKERGRAGKVMTEVNLVRKDGSIFPASMSSAIFEDAHGKKLTSTIIRDISESKMAEKELKRAKELAENLNVQKDHFIANMSHELRTPIHAILGFTELLLETETDRSKKLYIESVKTAGDNLLYIINDILDLSKIGAGIIQLEKQPFNLLFVIKDVFAILHLKAHQKKLLFNFYVDPEVNLHLIGDKNRLTQILINLLGNALKFTSTGSVELYVDSLNIEKGATTVQFRIVDTGIGIPEVKIGAIFDRFSQTEENSSRTFGGTGLGLNISKQLINRQGGDISVESEVGIGSVFSFYLPFAIGKVAPIREESQLAVIREKKRNSNILLCEDNELNQSLIQAILTEKGYSIDLAENGEKGISLLENKKYDLILMDIQMPIMDGYEATQKIRQEFGYSIPIVALTANFLHAERAKCLQLGMNDYLSKPFTKAAFLNTVDLWLSERIEEKKSKNFVEESQEQKVLSLRIMEELSGGSRYFQRQPFNLLSVIKNVFSILHLKAQQKKLLFEFHVNSEIYLNLLGDNHRLTQILINLLGNALKFTSSGAVKLIVDPLKLEKDSITLQFKVVDTGTGIPEGKINFIFDGFSQTEEDTSGTLGCSGLGLNISQQLIERQGGKIWIESEEGKGSTFIFDLPFGIEKVAPIQEKPISEANFRKRKASILLCEDNELNQSLISAIITEKGYSIDLAENGIKGLELLEYKSYDLILMDIQMPMMDGFEASQKIREELNSKTPIIALTDNFLLAEKTKCLQLGMNDYLSKPLKKAELEDTIDMWLNRKKVGKQRKILKEPKAQKILSLSTLEELSGGNKDFKNHMMNLFMPEAKKMFEQIKVFYEANDREGIKSTAHKLKTSFGIIGAESRFIDELQIALKSNSKTSDLHKILNCLEKQLDEIYCVLKKLIKTPDRQLNTFTVED